MLFIVASLSHVFTYVAIYTYGIYILEFKYHGCIQGTIHTTALSKHVLETQLQPIVWSVYLKVQIIKGTRNCIELRINLPFMCFLCIPLYIYIYNLYITYLLLASSSLT